jgi:predicted Zn-dependent peptidase
MFKKELYNGINMIYIPVNKFKTFTLNINIHRNLCREEATKNALLPLVLKRGCEDYKTSKVIAEYLEDMYGVIFRCNINKKGENQIISFSFEGIEDKYVPSNERLFEKVVSFASSILLNPLIIDNGFKKEYVEQEKLKLKEMIEGLINDKMSYAVERCYQEMCRDERFGVYELGNASDISNICEKSLYEHYLKVIGESPIDIFICGSLDKDICENTISKYFKIVRDNKVHNYPSTEVKKIVNGVKNITEELKVNQGKLSLGFRTKILPNDKSYYSLMVYNSILGGGAHSKLFNNVREKLSLAYYVFSRLERFKGVMIISSGIEIENYKKAYEEIITQMNSINNGEISKTEFDSSINSIVNGINSLQDNASQIIDYYQAQLLSGTQNSFEKIVEMVKEVTIDDVLEISKQIELDTVYFLKDKN